MHELKCTCKARKASSTDQRAYRETLHGALQLQVLIHRGAHTSSQMQISGKATRVNKLQGGQWNWQEGSESIWSTDAMNMHGRAHEERSEHQIE